MQHRESQLQSACVKWFDLQYPKYRLLLFAIPNGGLRSKIEANIMKGEGVRAGVADMFLSIGVNLGNGLYIEFKTPSGKQSEAQMTFQNLVCNYGYEYKIIRSFDEFKKLIENYLPHKF